MTQQSKYSDEDIRRAAQQCTSINSMLPLLGLQKWCGNWRTVRRAIDRLKIDISHFTGKRHMLGKQNPHVPTKDLQSILVQNSTYVSTSSLKKRLLQAGLIQHVCAVCGQTAIWKDKPLVMVLDHINGVHTDARLDNLRMLCPNCNSQQVTFCGKNRIKKTSTPPLAPRYCQVCSEKISRRTRSGVCRHCAHSSNQGQTLPKLERVCVVCSKKVIRGPRCLSCSHRSTRKVARPTKEELTKLVWEIPTSSLANKFGVSDVAIAKWCRQEKIEKPPRGYWAKQQHGPIAQR